MNADNSFSQMNADNSFSQMNADNSFSQMNADNSFLQMGADKKSAKIRVKQSAKISENKLISDNPRELKKL